MLSSSGSLANSYIPKISFKRAEEDMLNNFMQYYRKKMFNFNVLLLGGGDERHGAGYFSEENRFFCGRKMCGRTGSESGEKVLRGQFPFLRLGMSFLRSVRSASRKLGLGCKATAHLSSRTAI